MKKSALLAMMMAIAVVGAAKVAKARDGDRFRGTDYTPPYETETRDDGSDFRVWFPPGTPWSAADNDSDGIRNGIDNCVTVANPDQADFDGDDEGDVCDDSDGDGVMDAVDNCRLVLNPDQTADADEDGIGDVCDDSDDRPDFDGDGFKDAEDNCPFMYNSRQSDQDEDGLGDYCDNCRMIPNVGQEDIDEDGIGDICEVDWDGDGVIDDEDNCMLKRNSDQTDTDEDGLGDACDPRCDGPNCPVTFEAAPEETPPQRVSDGCTLVTVGGSESVFTGLILMIMAALSIAGIRKGKESQ